VNRWQAFIALCSYLRAGLLGGKSPSPQAGIAWEWLIEASSYHYVTPTLAWCLKEQPGIPLEVRDYSDTVFALNGKRNQALLAALTRVVAALNSIGIEPVLIKGAARLAERNYPAPGLRFLGDLDVLIPAERSSDAVASLQANGFANTNDPPAPHHLAMLHDRVTGSGVELHTDLTGGKSLEVIPTAWFYAGTRPCAFGDLQIRLGEATRSIGHIVVHDQLQDLGYQLRRVQLRQVLDLAMIRAGHESTIDWEDLDHRFCRLGFGTVLATYLAIAEALLGQPMPPLTCRPRPRAIEDFRRVIESSRWWQPWTRLASAIAARRRDPREMLELLHPHKLPGRVKRAFKHTW
jgi:Uncharacterised nucleotidyltransferase